MGHETLAKYAVKAKKPHPKADGNGEAGRTKAHEMAKRQRDISVAEFFEKNRHLLGFDSKRKALLTTVKEAVDNSLDACEEAGILPEITVQVIEMAEDRFRIIVEDNGPGIIKAQIPKVFAKLLYGSKFHALRQQRGQQGIGISASVMYGALTTGRPARILSKIHPAEPAHYYELKIDTAQNKPDIIKEEERDWSKDHGTKVEIDLEASYQKGGQSVDEYLKFTAIVNPHLTLIYTSPKNEQLIFPRATDQLPALSKEIKPHPYGVELGILLKMLDQTECRTLSSFLQEEFSRVGSGTAKEILEAARLPPATKPGAVTREMAEKLLAGIQQTKVMAPPTDCISPIGSALLEKGLKKEINAEFYATETRPPAVYRGRPFQVEVGIAYGGLLPRDEPVEVLRFANRVPLLYQPGACGVTKAIQQTSWRPYGLEQSGTNLPVGPAVILVHLASVWVPFTSEAKEAIAHYPEILKETKLALQEAGRQLQKYTAKKRRVGDELKKRGYIEKYIPHVALGLKELLGLKDSDVERVSSNLRTILEKERGELEDLEFDPGKNVEYDESFARIGKREDDDEDGAPAQEKAAASRNPPSPAKKDAAKPHSKAAPPKKPVPKKAAGQTTLHEAMKKAKK